MEKPNNKIMVKLIAFFCLLLVGAGWFVVRLLSAPFSCVCEQDPPPIVAAPVDGGDNAHD